LAIVIRDVSFSYFDQQVIRGVTATFDRGLVHLLLGGTGSGKTTLALVLAGLARPVRGSVTVDGCDPASDRFDRSALQLAFQFPEVQIFETTVVKEIQYGLRNFGLAGPRMAERLDWAIGCVGLPRALLPKDPGSISFGERRKVALASVIALKPKYLLLDEPLAGLDWHGRRNLVNTILRLRDHGLTTLVLTHEADLVAEIGDTVSILAGGAMAGPMTPESFVASGPSADALDQARHELLPDFASALHKISSPGHAIGTTPWLIEDVARAMIRAKI